jgi:FAD binding domain/Berberine and berberine like
VTGNQVVGSVHVRRVNRRDFLKYAGRASLAAASLSAPGCAAAMRVATASPARPTRMPSPAGIVPPTEADWTALAGQIQGSIVRPGDPMYGQAARLFNPRFDGNKPQAVVYSAAPADVQRTIAFARAHGLPLTPRSGGHSYAGYSIGTGLVCDVTPMAGVTVNGDGSAVVGAGARLIDVYAGLALHGVAVPAGSCPTVGIAGLALGGGVGVVGRKFGLTSDNLTAVEVVTAAGDLLTCDASTNSDLFWACRGGGGGNFGIVTSFTLSTHPLTTIALFQLAWPWAAAAEVVAAWQSWITTIPDELWSNSHLLSTGMPGSPTITVGGAYVGSEAALSPWLTTLRQAVGVAPTSVSVGMHGYLDGMLVEAGCGGQSAVSCHLAPQGTVQREASVGRSDLVLQPLSSAAIDAVIQGVSQRQADPATTTVAGVAFDAFGGAINRVAPDATAFVHRNTLFGTQYNATWPASASADAIQSNINGLNNLYAAMRPYASGFAYQNYIDPQLASWQEAYYGANLPRLKSVKSKYDPEGFFQFAQAIPAQ